MGVKKISSLATKVLKTISELFQDSSFNNSLNLDEFRSKSFVSKKFRILEMNTFRGSRNHSRPPTPINVTVNVQVNGFRLTDIALQAEIERHRKSEENSGHSQEEVIVRGLCDVAENSEDSQKVTNF